MDESIKIWNVSSICGAKYKIMTSEEFVDDLDLVVPMGENEGLKLRDCSSDFLASLRSIQPAGPMREIVEAAVRLIYRASVTNLIRFVKFSVPELKQIEEFECLYRPPGINVQYFGSFMDMVFKHWCGIRRFLAVYERIETWGSMHPLADSNYIYGQEIGRAHV